MSQRKPAIPEPTEIAGRYEVTKKLGAGAFGTVFKAKDKILGRQLAIKTIRLEGLAAAGASLDEMLDRFKREAQVSAQLKHPNIVTIYDIGDSDGMSYLAMEFIDGTGLDRLILESGKLSIERAASLGAQVADALDFAHKNNVVHRDIKPANIMIEAGDRVKVTDFGIAKLMDSGDHLTMTGSLLGTPSYMSPEQARGGVIDGRSDLFSLGCVVYEMLAGKKAFRGESITALIFKIITEEPPNIRDTDPDIPDEMVRIITKALSKSADTRYQSGRELADDLLALTRAGYTPTIRQVETATAPGQSLSPSASPKPTDSLPTLNAPLTVSSAATAIGAAAPPTQIQTPATRISPPPAPRPPVPSPGPPLAPPQRAAIPARAEASRKSGGGAGLLIGLGLAGFLFVAVAAGGAWYFFLRKGPQVVETAPTPSLAAQPSSVPVAPTPEPVAPTLAANPTDGGPTAPVTQPPATRPAETASRATTAPEKPPVANTPTTRPSQTAAQATEMAFLDNDEPLETTDGRAAGGALAGTYRSNQGTTGNSNYGTTGRFQKRERNPRPAGPAEMSAIKTMRYVMDNQEAYHRKNNRYGSFVDLFGRTPLDVPHTPEAFQRRGYRFNLEVSSDGYKVTAMPVQPGPRAFIGDDSGFIRAGLE